MTAGTRPHGAPHPRSTVPFPLLGLLALGWITACGQADEATDGPLPASVPEIERRVESHPPLLVVGLDGADWLLLDALIEAGAMPHLAALRQRGVRGTLLSEEPMLSPLLWTTMMTGTSPLDHRILDFTRHNPDTGQRELITSSERRRPAVWNMANAGGLEVAVYGVWATWPAEPVRGILVSDRLFSFLYGEEEPPPHLAYPPAAEQQALAALAEAERRTDLERLRELLPWLEPDRYGKALRAEMTYEDPVGALRRILIQTEAYAGLALERLRRGPPDLTILYLEGTDAVGHVFAPFVAPRRPEISAQEFERYSAVPRLYYGYVDDLLGELVEAAGDDVGILIVSDHGFRWRDRPHLVASDRAATAALWHRPEGVYLLAPAEAMPRRLEEPAGGVRQVTATIMRLLGLPPAAGVTGPPLPGVEPANGAPVRYAAYHTPVPEPTARPSSTTPDLDRLRALGYLGASDTADPSVRAAGTMTVAARNNEGLLLQRSGRLQEAEAAFRRALELAPERPETLANLGILQAEQGKPEQAITTLRQAVGLAPDAVQARLNLARALSLAGRGSEAVAQYDAALEHHPGDSTLRAYRAQALLDAGRATEAAEAFGELVEEMPHRGLFWVRHAQALALAGESAAARRRLEAGLERLPRNGEIRHALARLLLTDPDPARRDPRRAVELAQGVFAARPTLEHGETLAVALAASGERERAGELASRLLAEAQRQDADPELIRRLETLRGRPE